MRIRFRNAAFAVIISQLFCILPVSAESVSLSRLNKAVPEYNPGNFYPGYGFGLRKGKLFGRFGEEILVWGDSGNNLQSGLVAAPEFFLHNFSEGQSVPWQMWRARVELSWFYRALNDSGLRILLMPGFFHESNHVSDVVTYRDRFTPGSFDNKSLRSFEAFFISARFEKFIDRYLFRVETRPEIYTPPFDAFAERRIKTAFISEVFMQYHIIAEHALFIEFRNEIMRVDYSDAAAMLNYLPGDFLVRYAIFTGYRFKSSTGNDLVISIGYEAGYGRGMDFFRKDEGFSLLFRLFI